MKILIAADMEGISGVTRWEDTDPRHPEYARFRKIMTDEVNAAIAGCFEGGADECIVADGHGDGTNILIEALDKRARLNSGNGSPFSMMQGIDESVDGVIFVGYHARAGSAEAVLAHTWSSSRIANVSINGLVIGEYGLNAAIAGHYNVPVIMVTGDQSTCKQTSELINSIATVIVKTATGFFSAECKSPGLTQPEIRKVAISAVENLKIGISPMPFRVETPVTIDIEFRQPEFGDRAGRLPRATRTNATTTRYVAGDMLEAYAYFRSAVKQSYD